MGRPLTREILRPQHVQTCPHLFLFMFDLFTRSVSCHFRQLPLDNKVIPSFTRQERSQGGQDFFQKCLQWEMMS
jgi:hypothetical protein